MRDANGSVTHVVAFVSDLSVRRKIEERLRYLTHYDDLTGLANRGLLKERLQEACQRVRRNGRKMAVLYIDLDRFKLLNRKPRPRGGRCVAARGVSTAEPDPR